MILHRNASNNLHRDGAPAVDTGALTQWWMNGLLHRSDGPAVISKLGTEFYYWRGIFLAKDIYKKGIAREIPIKSILEERNAELRRAYIEMYGLERLATDAKADVLHVDTEIGAKLYCVKMQGDENVVFVQVLNSSAELDGTYKKYFIRVPPTMKTCKEAIAWTFEMKENEYRPEKET